MSKRVLWRRGQRYTAPLIPMHISSGATRTVLVTRYLAIKLPRVYRRGQRFEWSRLLQGLLANLQERYWAKFKYPQLCPVLFSDPLGIVLIMPRCEVMCQCSLEVMSDEEFDKFRLISEDGGCVPVENVSCNFGYLDGRLVSFDYGS